MSDIPAPRFGSLTLDAFIELLGSASPSPEVAPPRRWPPRAARRSSRWSPSLSADRPKYAAYAASHARHGAAGRELAARLLALADEDAAAYAAFAAALKLPRETDEEKAARTARDPRLGPRRRRRPAADRRGVPRASSSPSEALAGRSNLNAASDLAVASRLVEASAHGAAENVLVNLPSLGDEVAADELRGRVEALLAEIEELAEATRAHVERGELRDPETGDGRPRHPG